jgi:hypothetical protein
MIMINYLCRILQRTNNKIYKKHLFWIPKKYFESDYSDSSECMMNVHGGGLRPEKV